MQSWVIQGVLVGLLSVLGLSAVASVASVVSAKVAAYVVFAAQCVVAAKAK